MLLGLGLRFGKSKIQNPIGRLCFTFYVLRVKIGSFFTQVGVKIMNKSESIIQLDQFMKLTGMVSTGGQAKLAIQAGEVLLNGITETRRKKKLKSGDEVTFNYQTTVVAFE